MTEHPSDRHTERLTRLSEEMSRIAETMARLTEKPGAQLSEMPDDELPEVSAETVRSVLRARRTRARYLPEELFADPAWDILLDLLLAELTSRRITVSSACVAAAVPSTTALRWISLLVRRGMLRRYNDPLDGRRVFVELTPDTSVAMRRYFAAVEAGGPI